MAHFHPTGDGDDVDGVVDDVRISLFGPAVVNVVGNQLVVTETTTDANQLRDALLGDGINAVGDAEYTGEDSLNVPRWKHIIGIDSGFAHDRIGQYGRGDQCK